MLNNLDKKAETERLCAEYRGVLLSEKQQAKQEKQQEPRSEPTVDHTGELEQIRQFVRTFASSRG
jgi:hypothetical protein